MLYAQNGVPEYWLVNLIQGVLEVYRNPQGSEDNYAVFEDEVKSNFYFLEQQYGFRLNQIKQVGYAKVIRFESPSIYVNLFYGPSAYEPAISFGRIGIDDAPWLFAHGVAAMAEGASDRSRRAQHGNVATCAKTPTIMP